MDRLRDNPFYVLGLRPHATRVEVEREGQKLLGMIELGLASARTYRTPIGRFERTPDLVRRAMAELRDPDRRIAHELWAKLDPQDDDEARTPSGFSVADERTPRPEPWSDALAALGYTCSRCPSRGRRSGWRSW
jgi:hypothetical protein